MKLPNDMNISNHHYNYNIYDKPSSILQVLQIPKTYYVVFYARFLDSYISLDNKTFQY